LSGDDGLAAFDGFPDVVAGCAHFSTWNTRSSGLLYLVLLRMLLPEHPTWVAHRSTGRGIPVGFQNAAMSPGQRFHAAVSYSLRRPPRIGRRRILVVGLIAQRPAGVGEHADDTWVVDLGWRASARRGISASATADSAQQIRM